MVRGGWGKALNLLEGMGPASPESAGISAKRPEISRRASAHREVESPIMEKW